jgi:hypothetical protein
MDDPWGSPWADEQQTDNPKDVVRQEATLKTTADVPESAPPLSPWGIDDDGFGDWAEPSADVHIQEDGLKFDNTWKGDDERTGNGHLLEPSLHWNETSATNIPKLTPTLPSAPFEVERRPSSDPWAATTPDDKIGKGPGDDRHEYSEKTIAGEARDTIGNNGSFDLEPQPVKRLDTPIIDQSLKEDGSADGELIDGDDKHPEHVEELFPEVDKGLPNASNTQDAGHESSRPSSSPSDHSHRDEGGSDSPRTSLDEPKRAHVQRHVSAKVQELVEHFDSLANVEVDDDNPAIGEKISAEKVIPGKEEIPQITAVEATEQVDEDEDEDEDDFGDFEEGQLDVEEAGNTPVPVPDPPRSSTPVQTSPPRRVLKKDFGRVEFGPSVTVLDKLFSDPEEAAVEKIFIPDMVPYNSFTTVEERKAWYRISRYGTMKKHNTGNDENYVRVNWAKSQIRTDTLKTVAHWMEEDRVSGRVVLGGTSKGSSLFGWDDPNGQPMSVESAFASKAKKKPQAQALKEVEPEVPREWPKGLVRSRSTSKTRSSPSKLQRRSSHKSQKSSTSSIEIKPQPQSQSLPSVELPGLGWSERGRDSKAPTPIPQARQDAPIASKAASSHRRLTSSSRTSVPPNIVVPMKPTEPRKGPSVTGVSVLSPIIGTPTIPPVPIQSSNDDDDWGEMVSTPATPIHPVISVMPDNKKSKGLTGDLQGSMKTSIAANIQTVTSQTTSNLHKILVPSNGLHASSTVDPLSSAFDTFGIRSTPPTSNSLTGDFHQAIDPAIAAPASSNSDPWASVDFSFFDTAPAPPPKPRPASKTQTAHQRTVSMSKNPVSGSLSNSSSAAFPSSTPQRPMAPTKRGSVEPTPRGVSASRAKKTPLKTVEYAVPSSDHPPSGGKTRLEVEQAKIVADIVKGLPDLSYMLR